MAMERSCALLEKYADATIIDDVRVYDTLDKDPKVIEIAPETINNVLGLTIPTNEIISIFNRLQFEVEEKENTLLVTVPTRRQDISIKEDLIEEVARIYGIDKMEGILPTLPTKKGSFNKFNRIVRDKLISLGLSETLSYTLIPETEVHKYTNDTFEHINLLDPMSDDRKTLRYSLIPSMKMIYDYNAKRNNKDVNIFEIAKSFAKKENYEETTKLAVLMSGTIGEGLYKEKVTFYHIKGVLEELMDALGFNNRYSLIIDNLPKELHPGSSAKINVSGTDCGYIGKIHPNETKDDIYVLELNLDIIKSFNVKKLEFKEISKFPNVVKDIAFIIDDNISNDQIMKEIKKSAGRLLTNIELFDIYKGENIDTNKKSLAYKLTFNDKDNTLTDEVINPIFNKIMEDIKNKFNCEIRDK